MTYTSDYGIFYSIFMPHSTIVQKIKKLAKNANLGMGFNNMLCATIKLVLSLKKSFKVLQNLIPLPQYGFII